MANIIEIKNLNYSYNNKIIYNNISLNIQEGNFTTIIGPTGSGKSLLARILVGLVNSKSYVKIDGEFINIKNIRNIRSKIGYASENIDNLFVCDTVKDNITFYLKNKGYTDIQIKKKIQNLIDNLDILNLISREPSTLSGGEKQLIVVATIIALEPKIIILDESMTIIDPKMRNKIFKMLKDLNKKGTTIINFTQDSEMLLNGTEVIIINNGNIILQDKTKNAFKDVKMFTDNNIALPFIVDLSIKLQYYQTIDRIYFSSKKLVNDLWK